MDAYDFTAPLHPENKEQCHFGMDIKRTAKILRQIADKLETKRYCLQSARVLSLAKYDDFPVTTIRISFVEKKPEQLLKEVEAKLDQVATKPEVKNLWGAPADSKAYLKYLNFPVAVAVVE